MGSQFEKGFAADNRKEIEEVIYGEVYTPTNSQLLTSTFPKTAQAAIEVHLIGPEQTSSNQRYAKALKFEFGSQSNQVAKMYEKLNAERKRLREAGYFKNKQRDI